MRDEAMIRTLKEADLGKDRRIRLLTDGAAFIGLVIIKGKEAGRLHGESADDVWRSLHDEAARHLPGFHGWDGARTRFTRLFPNGFADPSFHERERNYKDQARRLLLSTAPVERAAAASGLGAAVAKAFQATNLLASFEMMRIGPLLKGEDADDVIQSAARFTLDPSPTTMGRLAQSLKRADAAKWPPATYLPFLWQPDRHMFLKPQVTKIFAERVGHPFADVYEPFPDWATYESLLDLTARMRDEFVAFAPADNVDLQSALWAISEYEDDPAE